MHIVQISPILLILKWSGLGVRIDNKSSPSFYVSCVYNPKADDENYY